MNLTLLEACGFAAEVDARGTHQGGGYALMLTGRFFRDGKVYDQGAAMALALEHLEAVSRAGNPVVVDGRLQPAGAVPS